MKTPHLLLASVLATLALAATARAEKPLSIANGNFEQSLTGWLATNDGGMSVASAAAAHAGKLGLRVTDASDTLGSSLATKRLPAVAGKSYEVRFAARVVTGAGIGVYLRFYDAKGKALNSQAQKNENILALNRNDTEWKSRSVKGTAPADTATVEVWIHSYTKNTVTADFDDVVLVEL
jgi:hypothetical protein